MVSDYIPIVLGIIAVATYVLQLWTGIAFAGWSGEQSLIERAKNPGPYWFVMALQTLVLVAIPVFIFAN